MVLEVKKTSQNERSKTMENPTIATVEMKLESCQGCNKDCYECPDINTVLDYLMILSNEIHIQDDAYDADIDRLAG